MAKALLHKRGVTLVEFLVSFFILILVVGGILYSFIRCLEFIELSKNMSRAVQAAQSKIDQIKSTAYNNIVATYDTIPFSVSGINGKGVVYVDDAVADLLEVAVVVCWQNENERLYGEDENLNGVLDSGEDVNSNARLDSPVEFTIRIFQR